MSDYSRVAIGIVGGMGPLAGARLVELITRLTKADCDQQHRNVLLVSMPGTIGDRTEYLLGKARDNPAHAIAECVILLERAGATHIGVACNTVHAAPIWSVLRETLQSRNCGARLFNMIEETCAAVRSHVKPGSRVGVLATTGTIRSDLYGAGLRAAGCEAFYLSQSLQERVHDAIYNPVDGIKAVPQVSARVRVLVAEAVAVLIEQGARCVILGCTELPLAFTAEALQGVPVIDPSLVLARRLVESTENSR